MEGSVGGGDLSTRDRQFQEWVSHSLNSKEIDGDLIPSSVRDATFTVSDLTKYGQSCALVKDAVDNGVVTHIAAPGDSSLDRQGETNANLVRSEGNVRAVPEKRSILGLDR